MTNELISTQWWKSSWLRKLESSLVWLSVFLVPWELRHTVYFASYGGNYFEYSSVHIYVTDGVMLILLLLWMTRGGRNEKVPRWIWGPILVWLVWITVAGALGIDWLNSLQQAAHYWLMAGWLMYLVNNITNLAEIVWPLVWGVILQAGIGVAQFLVNHDLGLRLLRESVLNPNQGGVMVVGDALHRRIRAYGLLPHPNMLGGLLAFSILPMAWLWEKTKKYHWVILLAFGLTGLGLVMTFSRTSWMVAGVMVLLWAGLMLANKWSKTGWLPLVILLLTAGAAAWSWQPLVSGRFELDSSLEQKSVNERGVGIKAFRGTVAGHWVAGLGLGNYVSEMIKQHPGQLVWIYKPVHDIYLLILGETGAVGLAIWLWMVGVGLWLWIQLIRRDWTWLWVGMPLVGILAGGLVDHWPVSFQQGRLLVFLALALIIWANQSIFRSVNR